MTVGISPPALFLLLLAGRLSSQGASAPEGSGELDGQRLKDLSIEELMDLEVTIATRSEESLSDLPAAVYVLTGDEIRRSGHSSIPEALRMVPGFHVSHWTTAAWDVTARGFGPGLSLVSSAYLNQLLVMVDGVVVYSPLFAGTWWHLLDIDLEDVDRIEIIRGPGGSLWGTNATHGVVNVITKKTADTQGLRVSLRDARDDRHVGVRSGGPLGENGSYRVWFKGAWYDTLENSFLNFNNDWNTLSTGFRTDWTCGGREFTFSSRFYQFENNAFGFDSMGGLIPVLDEKEGYQAFAGMVNPEANSRLQAWVSSDEQHQPTFLEYTIRTLDVEYQRELELWQGNRLTFGTGYRRVNSDLVGDDPNFTDFDPHYFQQDIFRGFLLDRMAISPLASELTLGLTVEHNDFTQFEVQPTIRLACNPSEDLMLWGAVSRAVRTPSLEERTLSSGSFFVGSDSFRSETLIAYELGARTLLSPGASLDLALFFNDYDDLHFEELDPMTGQFLLTNGADGQAIGAELSGDLKPSEDWTLRSAFSYLRGKYESKDGDVDLGTDDYYPEYQFNTRSYYDLGAGWEFDCGFYWVEKLGPEFDIAEYRRLDLRLAWHPTPILEIYVGGQHLTHPLHSEFDEFDQIHRSLFAGLNWRPGSSGD